MLEVPPLSHKCALTAVRNQPVHAQHPYMHNHDDDGGDDDNVSNLSKGPAMLEVQTDHDRRKFRSQTSDNMEMKSRAGK